MGDIAGFRILVKENLCARGFALYISWHICLACNGGLLFDDTNIDDLLSGT